MANSVDPGQNARKLIVQARPKIAILAKRTSHVSYF